MCADDQDNRRTLDPARHSLSEGFEAALMPLARFPAEADML